MFSAAGRHALATAVAALHDCTFLPALEPQYIHRRYARWLASSHSFEERYFAGVEVPIHPARI